MRARMRGWRRRWAQSAGLLGCWGWKPLLNGNDIQALGVAVSAPHRVGTVQGDGRGGQGRGIRERTEQVVDWQLLHPAGTRVECEEWLRALLLQSS